MSNKESERKMNEYKWKLWKVKGMEVKEETI